MIDFKRRDLYDREKTRMDMFLEKKLVTRMEQEEKELHARMGIVEDKEIDTSSILGGEALDLGDLSSDNNYGFSDSGMGGFGGAGDRSGVKDAIDWKQEGQPILTFFMAPLYLIKYIFMDMTKDFPKKEEWKSIIKAFNVGNMISISVALIEILIGINNIFTPVFQLSAGLVMFIITTAILHFVYKEDTYLIQIVKKILGTDKEKEENLDDFTFSDDDSFGDFEGILSGDYKEDFSEDLSNNITKDYVTDDYDDEDGEYEEYEDDEESVWDSDRLKDSPLDPTDDELFKKQLLDVFAKGEVNRGREYDKRIDILRSFSDYLIQNDRRFGKMIKLRERSLEYNNIAYSLFKGLSRIERQFGTYSEDGESEDKLVILDIKKSPILYRLEVELPNYFNERKIQNSIKVLEDVLRVSEGDFDVAVLVTTFQGHFVFKFLRFDTKTTISVGDILRYKDDDRGYIGLEPFKDNKYGLPVLFGLQNNEVPYIIDWEENTSGVIVGGSGSGKSWTTFMMMLNFIMANDYNNVQFIILDKKNSPFWNSFARLPHVLGYHTEVEDYIDVLMEVEKERKRRQEIMVGLGAENLKGYREKLRVEGRYDELKKLPLLFLIVDEITATMSDLKEQDEELFKTASNIMGQIASQGRSSGVRILGIGQRSTYDSIPKTLLANCSFKFGMKMNVENDFTIMFGKDVEKLKYPRQKGLGLSTIEEVMGIQTVKTLTVGGYKDEQILWLIRAMAFEWVRRGYDLEDFSKPPKGMVINNSFNRHKFLEQTLKEMKEGRILSPAIVSEGYEVNLNEEDGKESGYKIKRELKKINTLKDKEQKENIKEYEDEELEHGYFEETDLKDEIDLGYDDYKEEDDGGHFEDYENEVDLDWNSLGNLLTEANEIENNKETDEIKNKDVLENEENSNSEIVINEEIIESNFYGEPETLLNKDIEKESLSEIGESNKQQELEDSLWNKTEIEKTEAVPLEILLGVSEQSSEEFGEEIKSFSEIEGEEYSEEYSETKVIYIENKEISSEIKGEENKSKNSEKDHQKLHYEDHLKIPTEYHTITLEKYNTIDKGQLETKEFIETIENKKEENIENVNTVKEEIEKNDVVIQNEVDEENNEKIVVDNKDDMEIKEKELKDRKLKIMEELNRIEKEHVEEELKGVEIDFVTSITNKKEEPELPVKQYIAQYGEARGFNVFIKKEDLEEVYSKKTIDKALNRMAIVENKGYYMIKL